MSLPLYARHWLNATRTLRGYGAAIRPSHLNPSRLILRLILRLIRPSPPNSRLNPSHLILRLIRLRRRTARATTVGPPRCRACVKAEGAGLSQQRFPRPRRPAGRRGSGTADKTQTPNGGRKHGACHAAASRGGRTVRFVNGRTGQGRVARQQGQEMVCETDRQARGRGHRGSGRITRRR